MKKYGIISEKKTPVEFEARDLVRTTPEYGDLTVCYFGPSTFKKNSNEMRQKFRYPRTWRTIRFREATTAESILASSYDFKNIAVPLINSPYINEDIHLGRIIRTKKGVYVNPPKDNKGQIITNEKILEQLKEKCEEVNGIYLLDNGLVKGVRDFGFASYDSFEAGNITSKSFAEGGLARVLEHTKEKTAEKLAEISFNYKSGVVVWGFGKVENEPILTIATLKGKEKLSCSGYWGEDDFGYTIGILRGETK